MRESDLWANLEWLGSCCMYQFRNDSSQFINISQEKHLFMVEGHDSAISENRGVQSRRGGHENPTQNLMVLFPILGAWSSSWRVGAFTMSFLDGFIEVLMSFLVYIWLGARFRLVWQGVWQGVRCMCSSKAGPSGGRSGGVQSLKLGNWVFHGLLSCSELP